MCVLCIVCVCLSCVCFVWVIWFVVWCDVWCCVCCYLLCSLTIERVYCRLILLNSIDRTLFFVTLTSTLLALSLSRIFYYLTSSKIYWGNKNAISCWTLHKLSYLMRCHCAAIFCCLTITWTNWMSRYYQLPPNTRISSIFFFISSFTEIDIFISC